VKFAGVATVDSNFAFERSLKGGGFLARASNDFVSRLESTNQVLRCAQDDKERVFCFGDGVTVLRVGSCKTLFHRKSFVDEESGASRSSA
jgi:hypothetical protein